VLSRARAALAVLVLAGAVGGWLAVGTDGGRAEAAPECVGAAALDFACHELRYRHLVETAGVPVALHDLAERRQVSGYLRAACHRLLHVIGGAAGRRDGIEAFAQGDPLCSAGYYHGVVEAVMGEIGAEHIADGAGAVCASFRERERYSINHFDCVHGMGHGFMGLYGSDVFASLAGCDGLADPWEQDHCHSGVFMENVNAVGHPTRPARHLRPAEPLYPCTAVRERHKARCYERQTVYALYVRNDDFAAVFELCASSPDERFRPTCYRGIGESAAIRSNKQVAGELAQRDTIRRLCELRADPQAGASCVEGAASIIVRERGSIDVRALCASFGPELRGICDRAVAEATREYPADTRGHPR
jgi:hypothetical protein